MAPLSNSEKISIFALGVRNEAVLGEIILCANKAKQYLFRVDKFALTLETVFFCLVFGSLESFKPVSKTGSRQILVQQDQWRKHPGLLIPEHVTVITICSQASRTQPEYPRGTNGADDKERKRTLKKTDQFKLSLLKFRVFIKQCTKNKKKINITV